MQRMALFAILLSVVIPASGQNDASQYELVILNGRVMDPESSLDAVRHLGISAGKIRALSTAPLSGRTVIDARGLVVAPGFIDLHQHSHNHEADRAKVLDGVTSALDMEGGLAMSNAGTPSAPAKLWSTTAPQCRLRACAASWSAEDRRSSLPGRPPLAT